MTCGSPLEFGIKQLFFIMTQNTTSIEQLQVFCKIKILHPFFHVTPLCTLIVLMTITFIQNRFPVLSRCYFISTTYKTFFFSHFFLNVYSVTWNELGESEWLFVFACKLLILLPYEYNLHHQIALQMVLYCSASFLVF